MQTLDLYIKRKSCCKHRGKIRIVNLQKSHPGRRVCCPAIYCYAAEYNARFKSSGRLLGFCENYGNAGEMDEQHFTTINQAPLINKVHFLFSMIQGIIKRTLSLSF